VKREHTANLIGSQKTVWYYPEELEVTDSRLQERSRYFELLQSSMLIQDVHNQIIPFEGFSKKIFSISLTDPSESIAALIASALDRRDRGRSCDLVTSVTDFFRECAQSLMIFGEAVYEIVYFSNPSDQKIVKFELERVRPLTVTRRRRQVVQAVPESASKQQGLPRFIHLPADRVLIFELPERRNVAAALESLAVLSTKLMPQFVLKNFQEATSKFHYDSSGQIHSQKLALAEAGKAIGWNARGLFDDDMLEFYSLRRALSFERFKIDLRNSILTKLNEGLTMAGREMGFNAKITVDGLPTIPGVEAAESELESGSKAFSDILKPFLLY
jgi:hypothetical protein